MKFILKTIIILLIILNIFANFQCIYAIDGVTTTGISVSKQNQEETDVGDKLGLGDLDSYKPAATTSTKLKSKLGVIFSVISTLGSILSVIILVVIGIKYMMASVEEKATFKKSMIPYIIGVAILFAGTYLPQFIYSIVQQIGWI